jgi:Flp pilus assembly protein TadG
MRKRRRRASVMLEFALVLPFMLYMLAFTLDMGRMIYASHAAQTAITDAARQSAVFGAAGGDGNSDADPLIDRAAVIATCNASTTNCRMALHATQQALASTPGGKMLTSWTLSVAEDAALKLGRVCTSATPAVKLRLAYDVNWLTPGMDKLLSIGNESAAVLGPQSFSASATMRCEVEVP